MRFEDRETHLYEDDHDPAGDSEGGISGGRRLLLLSGAGAGLAAVAITAFIFIQQGQGAPAAPAAEQPVAVSPDGLSPQVSEAQLAAGSAVAKQGLAGKLGLPTGVSATDVPAIPATVLLSYRRAEATLAASASDCRLPWWVLAGIGKVETDHANGGRVDAKGLATPFIRGPRLDGTVINTQMVLDTDRGTLDGDTMYDRGMGMMQLTPGTWRLNARDGDGDGTANPDDVYDAALTAGTYLCSSKADLGSANGLSASILHYNNRPEYLRSALQWGAYYRGQITPPKASPAPIVPGPVKTAVSTPTGAPTVEPAPDLSRTPTNSATATTRPGTTVSSAPGTTTPGRTPTSGAPTPAPTRPGTTTTVPTTAPLTTAPAPTTTAPAPTTTAPAPTRTTTTTTTTTTPPSRTAEPTRTTSAPQPTGAPEPTSAPARTTSTSRPATSAPEPVATTAPTTTQLRVTVAPTAVVESLTSTILPALPEGATPTR